MKSIAEIVRDVPSTKARQRSYNRVRDLMFLLSKLDISNYDYDISEDRPPDYFQGWKRWVNTYTPPDKRGLTGDPKLDKRILKGRNNVRG